MKKYICIIAAAALMFGLASCNDIFFDDASISTGDRASDWGKNGVKSITHVQINTSDFDNTSSDLSTFVISFLTPVASETVKSALKVYALSGEDADELYTETEIDYSIAETTSAHYVEISLNLYGVNGIRVYVDGSKFTALNGTKLNIDEDKTVGEAGDDDWFTYLYATSPDVNFAGQEMIPLADGMLAWQFINRFVFKNDTNGNPETVHIVVENDFYDDATEYTALFNENLYLQYYDCANAKWEKKSLTFSDTTDADRITGDPDYHYFTAALDLSLDYSTFVRVVTDNIQNLKTVNPVLGFVRRQTLENTDRFRQLVKTNWYGSLETVSNVIYASDSEFGVRIANCEDIYVTVEDDESQYTVKYGKAVSILYLDVYKDAGTYVSDPNDLGYYEPDDEHSYNVYDLDGYADNALATARKVHFFNDLYEEIGSAVASASYYNGDRAHLVIQFEKPVVFAGEKIHIYAEKDFSISYVKSTYTWDGSNYAGPELTTVTYRMYEEDNPSELLQFYAPQVKGMRLLHDLELSAIYP